VGIAGRAIALVALGLPLLTLSCKAGEEDSGRSSCAEGSSDDTLESVRASQVPTLDGLADDSTWACLPELAITVDANILYTPEGSAQSPSYPGLTSTTVQLRSVYTDSEIFFLVTWEDPTLSLERLPWEKQPDGAWAQSSNKDSSGHENTWYEDKFAIQWNIDSPTFTSQGCSSGCHDTSDPANPGNKYNPAGELTDMWHWKSVRTEPNGQLDDKLVSYLDSGLCDGENCRVADSKESGGYTDNTYAGYGGDCAGNPDGTLSLPCFMGPDGDERMTDTVTLDRALVLAALISGCAETNPCADTAMGRSASGLILTPGEHPDGWGRAACEGCHAMASVHRSACSPGVDFAALRALITEQGYEGCPECHGDNGVEP